MTAPQNDHDHDHDHDVHGRPPAAGTGPDADLLFSESIVGEAHPGDTPQSPTEVVRKIRSEAGEGKGLIGKARRVLQEMDRDIGGEYERREDSTGERPHPDAP